MEPFKNRISADLVRHISTQLQVHITGFDPKRFERAILKELENLELKERAQLIADHLHQALPPATKKRAQIIRAMLHPRGTEKGQQSDAEGITGWGMFPLGMVVGQYGLADFESSLELLKDMTGHFSSEFDVRYFLIEDQERALAIMGGWVDHPNFHVRRLLSEGTRPRLPWGMQLRRLIHDPSPMLPLLEALRDDPEEYVRRSVANHLNDIAKDHPNLVAKTAKRWLKGASPAREKLVRHACRSLIKQGHKPTLEAFGLGVPQIAEPKIIIDTKTVRYGDTLQFSTTLLSTSKKPQSLVIDYLVHFKKANGERVGKVFKWKKLMLAPGERVMIEKTHPIKPITTRKYYAGKQGLSLRINGADFGFEKFSLMMPT
ncbi:DNA alkylation repair protein [Parvibaculaceae bacterium PLY_AMNH_Bact1]|nr:DNA alkylation repair protein [Parvibaculaceae bacterium PLY_AMNH_Bact1]